jgi:hypothetical protein
LILLTRGPLKDLHVNNIQLLRSSGKAQCTNASICGEEGKWNRQIKEREERNTGGRRK